jgi:hypothetical protein
VRARLTYAILLAALLTGCAALSRPCCMESESDPQPLTIAPAMLGERTVEQRLVIRWPGGERSMDAVLDIADGKLRLVLLSFGMRLLSLEYDGRTVSETRYMPQAPSGRRMVNDLLLMAAPLEDLRPALPENWRVTENKENNSDHPRRREITQDGKLLIVIAYSAASPWQGRVEFEHHALGYQLILDSHEL